MDSLVQVDFSETLITPDNVDTSRGLRLRVGETVRHSKWLFSSALLEHGVEGTSDDEPANLAGPRADFIQLCVAQESSGGVVVDVAVPSCGEGTHTLRARPGTGFRLPAGAYPNTECHPEPPEWRSRRNAG